MPVGQIPEAIMIEIKNVSKQFNTADGSVEALKNVSISIPNIEDIIEDLRQALEKVNLL